MLSFLIKTLLKARVQLFASIKQLYENFTAKKKFFLQSIKSQIRKQMIKQENDYHLDTLINQTQTQIDLSQLQILIKLVNQDYNNAIIHFGNLLLDQLIDIQIVKSIILVPKSSQYWPWLIRILQKNGCLNFTLLDYCLLKILRVSSEFSLQHSLEAIKSTIEVHRAQSLNYLFNSDKNILPLIQHCFFGSLKIQKLSFDIIFSMVEENESYTVKFISIFKQSELKQFLKKAFMKSNNKIKVKTVRILNNIICSGQQLPDIYMRYINSLNLQSQSVKTQLSFLVVTFLQTANQHIFKNFYQQGIIKPIVNLKNCQNISEKNRNCIQSNIFKCLQILYKKKSLFTQVQWKKIQLYLKKYLKQFIREQKENISLMEAEQSLSNNQNE